MKSPRPLLVTSCVLTLAALGLMIWAVYDPRPIPVITAMSVGQLLGTLSLTLFLYVVWIDLRPRLSRAWDRISMRPPTMRPPRS
jgi:hypothetical protein